MNIYFDTEFTGLHKNTTLVSLGCISEDGRTFYAEFNDYDKSQCNDWIKENVIKNLCFSTPKMDENEYYHATRSKNNPTGNCLYEDYSVELRGDREAILLELKVWLSQFNHVQFVSDVCHYDFVLLIDLFGDAFSLPTNVSPYCHDINQDIALYTNTSDSVAFDLRRETLLEHFDTTIDGNKHNALYDAKVIKTIYENIKSKIIFQKDYNLIK